jgi:3-dehydroquinate dehydratase II
MKIVIINGPNLNLLGKRETEIYGTDSFEEFFEKMKLLYPRVELLYYQSNSEGGIIDDLQKTGFTCDGIILNAGAYTHTSLAIADAIASLPAQVIEVHISNIYKREDFRHHSFLAAKCIGVIAGFGLESYRIALDYFVNIQKKD